MQHKVHERNYPIHDLELVAEMFAFKILRHYLYGFHVDVFTNHKSLQYVFMHKEFNLWKRRWLELLKDYDMSVFYDPDKANVLADAVCPITMGSVSHFDEAKKYQVMEVYWCARLGVRF